MDTKSKSIKGFFVWIGLIIGLSASIGMTLLLLPNASEFLSIFKDSFNRDYFSTDKYAESVIALVQDAVDEVSYKKSTEGYINQVDILNDGTKFDYFYADEYDEVGDVDSFIALIGENSDRYASLICISHGNLLLSAGSISGIYLSDSYYRNAVEGSTNYKQADSFNAPTDQAKNEEVSILVDGIDYHAIIIPEPNDADLSTVPENNNKTVDITEIVGDESFFCLSSPYDVEKFAWLQAYLQKYNDFTLCIAIKENAIFLPPLYANYARWGSNMMSCYILIACAIVFFLLILQGLLFRRARKQFISRLMRFTGWFLLEIKIVAVFCTLYLILNIYDRIFDDILAILLMISSFWMLWYMILDLYYNGRKVFKNNIPYHIISIYRRYESKKPFYKALMTRTVTFIIGEFLLVLFFLFTSSQFQILSFLCVVVGIAFALLYIKKNSELFADMDQINQKLSALRNGEDTKMLEISPEHNLYNTAVDLNNVQDGIKRAVNEMMRSERLKVDLITNVSHDLKTPLTSIISYIELLSNERLLPDKANEYVNIIKTKASHLDRLTNDLVEISKAQSGNIKIVLERIDITSHIRQTLAELSERIDASGLDFKVTLPEKPLYINADGGKLYRVYENLIINSIKYSMPGTRVYIIVTEKNEKAFFEIKNIASYEMNFSVEDITERFTRGDNSRTTEGSGLGLSIAKTYVELCNGKMHVATDGDLFKVTIEFTVCNKTDDTIKDIEEAIMISNSKSQDNTTQTA